MFLASIIVRFRRLKRLSRITGLSWPLLIEMGLLARGRWRSLSRRDRAHLARLLRRSRGWPGNLSRLERAELWALFIRMDLRTLAGEVVGLWRGSRRNDDALWRRRMAMAVRMSRRGATPSRGSASRRYAAWRPRSS
jgi:hypothetical protein